MATPGPRVRQPEIRPDQILDAAEALLLRGGAGAMTMDAVAGTAGVGKGTIYHYYRSKTDVLRALRTRYLQRTVADATAAADGGPPNALERIDRFFDSLLSSLGRQGELIWILFHEASTEKGEDELAQVRDALLVLVTDGVAAGQLRVADVELTTDFVLHGFHGVVESSLHRGDADPERLQVQLHAATRALLGG
jgi:AcrR family transcriptional regulator